MEKNALASIYDNTINSNLIIYNSQVLTHSSWLWKLLSFPLNRGKYYTI